ncbi:MAG TPA: YpdA family putative bacillithiol disulfide reductase [Gemmatimonadaceae bacterium]|nr:YpdA family putative bacillithiol disulfide reductase [Gemmatimonadaceae bacterium]
MAKDADLVIVGGGPCGLAAAVSAQRAGLTPLVIESNVVVSTIESYPIYVRFFSTAEKLTIGGLPFVIATEKPTRRDALAYYRAVVTHFRIPLRQRERVVAIRGKADDFTVVSVNAAGEEILTRTGAVVVATGYFGSPNRIGVPGENLPHVTHVYREGHEAFMQDVVVVGGGNSAAEAALDLWRSGARVTLVHFGPTFDKKIKPWVLPDFTNRVKEGLIRACWDSRIKEIYPDEVLLTTRNGEEKLKADRVYIMTGFAPSLDLLRESGVPISSVTGIPQHNSDTLETSVPGLFIAGVVVAGYDANKVFIENGRYHGDRIVARLLGQRAPAEPKLSAELDT